MYLFQGLNRKQHHLLHAGCMSGLHPTYFDLFAYVQKIFAPQDALRHIFEDLNLGLPKLSSHVICLCGMHCLPITRQYAPESPPFPLCLSEAEHETGFPADSIFNPT